MPGMRIIDPKKLVTARGIRSRSQIAKASGGKIREQDLYNYEKGNNMPRPERVPHLLAALGVTYEQISSEMELAS